MESDPGQTADASSNASTASAKAQLENSTDESDCSTMASPSPLGKSRYGRTRKPKITRDFYDIDAVLDSVRETKKTLRAAQKPAKQPQPSPSPNRASATPKTLRSQHFAHVTGDSVLQPTQQCCAPKGDGADAKYPMFLKLFERDSDSTPTQDVNSAPVNDFNGILNSDISALAEKSLNVDSVDVTKVLKIVATKPSDQVSTHLDFKPSFKPVLKTYSNKRKNFQKTAVVESFALPDKPIFPLESHRSVVLNEPKRIKSLDLATPSSENDVNLVDKKLLDTPWKIASMTSDFADSESLLENCDELTYDGKDGNMGNILLPLIEAQTLENPCKQVEGVGVGKATINGSLKNAISPTKQNQNKNNVPLSQRVAKSTKTNKRNKLNEKMQWAVVKVIRIENDKKKEVLTDVELTSLEKPQKSAVVCNNSPRRSRLSLKKPEPRTETTPIQCKIETPKIQDSLLDKSKRVAHKNHSASSQNLNDVKSRTEKKQLVNKLDVAFSEPLQSPEKSTSAKEDAGGYSKKRKRAEKSPADSQASTPETSQKRKRTSSPKKHADLLSSEKSAPIVAKNSLTHQRVLRNHRNASASKEVDENNSEKANLSIQNKSSLDNSSEINMSGVLTRSRVSGSFAGSSGRGRRKKIHKIDTQESVVASIPDVVEIKQEPHDNSDENLQAIVNQTFGKKSNKRVKSETFSCDLQIKTEEFELGDLMWAKIGGHPYWPCMICLDPESNEYKKSSLVRKLPVVSYHVRFFGDRGRRSWVYLSSMLRYNTKDDLKIFHEKLKSRNSSLLILQPYIVKVAVLPKWQVAVAEAESLKLSSVQERFDFFERMLSPPRWKKPKQLIDVKDNIKQEVEIALNIGDSPIKVENNEVKSKTKRHSAKMARATEQVHERRLNRPKSLPSSGKLKVKDECYSQHKKESAKASLKTERAMSSPTQKLALKVKDRKESRENSLDESLKQFFKNPWQAYDIPQKQINTILNEVNSECSLSDSDSMSKSSSNTPVPEAFQVQMARLRKNNLFRGVPRHRVCQVCKKPGNVLKCKGPCNGLFHYNCASLVKSEGDDKTICINDTDESGKETLDDAEVLVIGDGNCKNEHLDLVQEMTPSDTNYSLDVTNLGENNNKVEIIYIDCDDSDFEHTLTSKVRLTPDSDFAMLSLSEQIDLKMKEIMQGSELHTRYADSTTDYTSSEESNSNCEKPKIFQKKRSLKIKHITADCISLTENTSSEEFASDMNCENGAQGVSSTAFTVYQDMEKNMMNGDCEGSTDQHLTKDFKCGYCSADLEPPCFVCNKEISAKNTSFRQKCSLHMCGKFYHQDCLKMWPHTQWSLISTTKHKNSNQPLDTFVCPMHVCHTCASDNPHAALTRCSSDKVVKCLRCPATYHTSNYCVPAGTIILSTSQIVCPRHSAQKESRKNRIKNMRTINTPWCFLCSKGGELICCETCPTSVHTDCLQVNLLEDGTFICEDCETGRFPLYDEIVWVKLGSYRWWPAVILFPNEVPNNVKNLPHSKGEFVVKFFGTHDHYWVSRGRVFLFQEGDRGHCGTTKKRVDAMFKKSIEEATAAHQFKKTFKSNKEAEIRAGTKPPPYIRIKVNRPVGNVRLFDGNISNTTSCECNPQQANPCGPDSDCLNRLLLTECNPEICPAKNRCNNQRFEKRQYPPMVPFKTPGRGWGLKTLAPIRKGDFVIEYVGEVIDEQEYQRRIRKMHEQKDENYYFLTIDKDRIIDAGPKGNLARFMNHCCQPNCETQKWTVNGDTRVGLFAVEDIPVDTELTFNYNLECIGKEKKICKCGAPNCSGFIGVKAKADDTQKKLKKTNSGVKKKKQNAVPQVSKCDGPCFICGQHGNVGACCNKICTKFFHLHCMNLESWPEGKWVCPWHNCNVCGKRTIRCCVKCLNSYCPIHSDGNVRYDKLLGFVCSDHDPSKESQEIPNQNVTAVKNSTSCTTEETDVTSTTPDEVEPSPLDSDAIDDQDLILSESVTSTPIKKKDGMNFAQTLEQFAESGEVSTEDIPYGKVKEGEDDLSNVVLDTNRKKLRPKRGTETPTVKKMKLYRNDSSKTAAKPKPNFTTSNLLDMPAQKEVKLSSSVPSRHLRTTRSSAGANLEAKRFLSRQNELEKDLPMRKRSRPRCEATL